VTTPDSPHSEEGQHLVPGASLQEAGTAFVWDILEYGRPARAFVLRFKGEVRAYVNRCLHVPAELDWQPGEFMDSDKRFIICSIHGATYDPVGGHCMGGPCGRGRLTVIRVDERAGEVYWYPSRDIKPARPFDPATARPPTSSP
jgi:nitrite reductase/ring-hydroxylating ferredoxin subunit